MKVMKKINTTLLVVGLFLMSGNVLAQDTEKVFFAKTVPTKVESKLSYSFMVGYVVNTDSDIGVDVSGGPNKFWMGTKKKVKKGPGILKIELSPENVPAPGKNYRIILSVRDRNGGWQSTRVATVINNLEFVKEEVRVAESVSFSALTPYKVESSNLYSFDVVYVLSNKNIVQVSIWNDKNWLATSEKIEINPGNGTQSVAVKMAPPKEGTKYKFVLTFGTEEEFNAKRTKSKERSGIHITKPEKQLTIKEINAKSVQIALNKDSEVLTLPGKSSFKFIRVIAMNGQILAEVNETNSIKVSHLTKGAYFAITNTGDYYKFVKF